MKWFTADHHFGHDRIIEYCNRPYKNAKHMETCLIKNINEKVAKDDELIIVGDFTVKGDDHKGYIRHVFNRIKCEKVILIIGNHDTLLPRDYVEYIGFHSVHTMLEIEGFVVHHDPSKAYRDKNRIWITAHSHDYWKINRNRINVGVDVWNYYPVNIEVIKECAKTIQLNK